MTYPVTQSLSASTFHPIRIDLAENSIRNTLTKYTIMTADAAQIREFVSELRSCKNISAGWANKLTFPLIAWRRFISPFSHHLSALSMEIHSLPLALIGLAE